MVCLTACLGRGSRQRLDPGASRHPLSIGGTRPAHPLPGLCSLLTLRPLVRIEEISGSGARLKSLTAPPALITLAAGEGNVWTASTRSALSASLTG